MQHENRTNLPCYILRAVPTLNSNALQRTLHPQLITARTAWHWPLPQEISASSDGAPYDNDQAWLVRVRAAAVLAEPGGRTVFAFVSRAGTAVLARPGGGLRLLRVPATHSALSERAVSVALFELRDEVAYVAAVGYTSGAVMLFDARTAAFRCASQPISAEVRRLRYHADLDGVESTGALFAVAASGELCLLPASQISALLRAGRAAAPTARGWTLWNVPSRGRLIEAVPVGMASASICEIDPRGPRAPLRVISAGAAPALCAYECSRDPVFSASAVAKKAASSMYTFARGLFSSTTTDSNDTEALDPASDAGVDPTRILASASLGPFWNDHEGSDRTFTLQQVKNVRDSARKSVGAVLKAPAKVLKYSSSYSGLNDENVTSPKDPCLSLQVPVLKSQTDVDDDGDPANASMDAATLRDLLSRTSNGDQKSSVSLHTNERIVGRIAAAPLTCGLVAAVDNLGRVLVQDVRDMVVIRVLKGYRDAQVAWIAPPSDVLRPPLLVILASRINVLEVHPATSGKRIAAFRVPADSRLVHTPTFRVFCIAPSGALHELILADRKNYPHLYSNGSDSTEPQQLGNGKPVSDARVPSASALPEPPDNESVYVFLEATRKSNIMRLTEILQSFDRDPAKVAYLLARLLVRTQETTGVSPDVHVSVAACALKLAASNGCPDLERRYFAHQRLAESYALLCQACNEVSSIAKPRLLFEDKLGRGLAEIAGLQCGDLQESGNTALPRKIIECEDFIVAHVIAPGFDYESKMVFSLQPKDELSSEERKNVTHTYFAQLLGGCNNTGDVIRTGDERTSCRVHLALSKLHALPVAEIASLFVSFFLNTPLDTLLSTPANLFSSGLRCMLVRLRSSTNQKLVDEVILSECEAATVHAVNALLLARLCSVGDSADASDLRSADVVEGQITRIGDRSPIQSRYFLVTEQLEEVVYLRRLVAGTKAARKVICETTALSMSGTRGDAELFAVQVLVMYAEYNAAATVLQNMMSNRSLDWNQACAVAEASIAACRTRASKMLAKHEQYYNVILPAVAFWIRGEKRSDDLCDEVNLIILSEHCLGIRTVMLAAHAYIPDASVDAVRCLQLAEAMNAVMMEFEKNEVSGGEKSVISVASIDGESISGKG